MMSLPFKHLGVGLAGAALLLVSACETATPYQPLAASNLTSGGYSDQKISRDRYRITFQGNSITQRETVERYLLYRAAELTTQAGYDWFELVDRNTERQTRSVDIPVTDTYWGWRPTWAYLGNNHWTIINTYEPFWYERYQREDITRYQASAEIFLGHGEKPANDPRAFDAHEVVANLEPTIQRPEARG
ncbi:MAG: hypothetical protein WCI21_00165 [Alphaproteobacteria bacterium]